MEDELEQLRADLAAAEDRASKANRAWQAAERELERLRATIIQMRDSGHELPASLCRESETWEPS